MFVPLYVSYIFHGESGGWTAINMQTDLQLSFVYDTAILWQNGVTTATKSKYKGQYSYCGGGGDDGGYTWEQPDLFNQTTEYTNILYKVNPILVGYVYSGSRNYLYNSISILTKIFTPRGCQIRQDRPYIYIHTLLGAF